MRIVSICRQKTQLGISQGEDQRGRELDGVRGQRGGGGDRRQYQVRGVTWHVAQRHVSSAVSRQLVRGDTWLEQVVCDQTVRLYIVTGVRDTVR